MPAVHSLRRNAAQGFAPQKDNRTFLVGSTVIALLKKGYQISHFLEFRRYTIRQDQLVRHLNAIQRSETARTLKVPFVIREFQATPNPNALKFVLDKTVSDQPMSFLTPAAAENHALAKQLFAVTGVTSVLLLGDFITINKSPQAKWPDIKRNVQHVLSGT